MFNNIWIAIQSWFENNERYKTSEERYGEELINQIVILNEIDTDKIGEEVEEVVTAAKVAWHEWIDHNDVKTYNHNGWLDDKVNKYEFIQRAYILITERADEYDEGPKQIISHQVEKLLEMGSKLNDALSSNKSTMEQLDYSRKDKRKLEKEKADLTYQVRILKERAFKDLQEKANQETLDTLDKARELFYGVFSYGDLFREQVLDWVRDAMETDSERVVPCGSDLAERCEGIVQEHENNSEAMYDIAREIIGDYDFSDVMYNNDIPDEDKVSEMIGDEAFSEDDFHELFEDAIENHTINKSGVNTNIKATIKEMLIQMLQLMTNDLSRKGTDTYDLSINGENSEEDKENE